MEFSVNFRRHADFELDVSVTQRSVNTMVGLTGPSGAGKSSLLRCLAGLERHAQVSGDWQGKLFTRQAGWSGVSGCAAFSAPECWAELIAGG